MDITPIEKLLENQGSVAIIWHTEDVQYLRPDLTDSQCMDVLRAFKRQYEADVDRNWQTIQAHAETLYPAVKPESRAPAPTMDLEPEVY